MKPFSPSKNLFPLQQQKKTTKENTIKLSKNKTIKNKKESTLSEHQETKSNLQNLNQPQKSESTNINTTMVFKLNEGGKLNLPSKTYTNTKVINRIKPIPPKPEEIKEEILGRIDSKETVNTILSNKKALSRKEIARNLLNLSDEVEALVKLKNYEEIKEDYLLTQPTKSDDFALGLFCKSLKSNMINCKIVKDNGELKDYTSACMHAIISGVAFDEITQVTFDFGFRENQNILKNPEIQSQFKKKWINNFAQASNIDKKDVEILRISKGSIIIEILGVAHKKILDLMAKFKEIRKVELHPVLSQCLLTLENMDSRGDNSTNWPCGVESRGGENYYPPYGWTGYGLKVEGVYENDQWLKMDGNENEWCVAYHGVKDPIGGEDLEKKETTVVKNIIAEGFREGPRQEYENFDDLRHPGQKCNKGIYCTPLINEANEYALATSFKVNEKEEKYQVAFQCRINPKTFRQAKYKKEYYIVNSNDIRPYRLLIKKEGDPQESQCYLGCKHDVSDQLNHFKTSLKTKNN